MVLTLSGIFRKPEKPLQKANTSDGISVTDGMNSSPLNPEQCLNADRPSDVTLLGIFNEPLNFEQLKKALSPIDFTVSGMVRIPDSWLHESKEPWPIDVMESVR